MSITEMMAAIAILTIAILPLGYALNSNSKQIRASYQRAVAIEIVDGEMEILAAGGWHDIPEGTRPYSVHLNAAANLPAGGFVVSRDGNKLRLEWRAAKNPGSGAVIREATVK